jgi:hypothetical protein
MDERLLDVIIGCAAFMILIILLALLPAFIDGVIGKGTGYLVAILAFILFLSGAGYWVNEKIT